MTFGFAVKVFFEIVVVFLVAYGIFHEEKLISFEEELFPVLKFCIHKYILKDNAGTRNSGIKTTRSRSEQRIVRRRASVRVIAGNGRVETRGADVA